MHKEKPVSNMSHKEKLIKYIPHILFVLLLILVFTDGINLIRTRGFDFDDCYNGQVAANFAKTGKYMTSYPTETVFHNIITTGQNVLMFTALLYKIFGVGYIATGLVPLMYGLGAVVYMYLIFRQIVGGKYGSWFALFGCVLFLGNDYWFESVSTGLKGEPAAFFYVVAAALLLICGMQGKSRTTTHGGDVVDGDFAQIASTRHTVGNRVNKGSYCAIFFAGICIASALIAKTSSICFVIVFFTVLLIETVLTRRFKWKSFAAYLCGTVVGFCGWEIFKLWQYDWHVSSVLQWWINEKSNAASQTGTSSLFGNCTLPQIAQHFDSLKWLFDTNPVCIALLVILPIVGYLICFVKGMMKKETMLSPMVHLFGLSGDSLLIYFVLFGSDGLIARRMCAYASVVWVYDIGVLLVMVQNLKTIVTDLREGQDIEKSATSEQKIKSMKKLILQSVLVIMLILSCRFTDQKVFLTDYVQKEEKSDNVWAMEEMVQYLKALPEDATIYIYGYWQAPELSLFSGRRFVDIQKVLSGERQANHGKDFFVIGSAIEPPGGWEYSVEFWVGMQIYLEKVYHAPHADPQAESNTIYVM